MRATSGGKSWSDIATGGSEDTVGEGGSSDNGASGIDFAGRNELTNCHRKYITTAAIKAAI
jgi:hypothetical protein